MAAFSAMALLITIGIVVITCGVPVAGLAMIPLAVFIVFVV